MITLNVNGNTHAVDADPATPLLYVLTDHLGLNGAKYGCGLGVDRMRVSVDVERDHLPSRTLRTSSSTSAHGGAPPKRARL